MFDPETTKLVARERRAWLDLLHTEPKTIEREGASRRFEGIHDRVMRILDRQDAEVTAAILGAGH